jgi:hypothetical protein
MIFKQIQAVRCAHVDLCHVLKAHELGELADADWEAVKQSIIELEDAFDFLTAKGWTEQ